jgi:hypothetical protein
MMRIVLFLLLSMAAASAQQLAPIEQRLGATIGALIVENNRLALALEEANKTIAQLKADLDKAKQESK